MELLPDGAKPPAGDQAYLTLGSHVAGRSQEAADADTLEDLLLVQPFEMGGNAAAVLPGYARPAITLTEPADDLPELGAAGTGGRCLGQ